MAPNVYNPGATSRVLCAYVYALCVYVCAPDAASRDMCCCSIMPLMPIPGLSKVHDPDATSRVLFVYVYVLCVSVPLMPFLGLYFDIHAP